MCIRIFFDIKQNVFLCNVCQRLVVVDIYVRTLRQVQYTQTQYITYIRKRIQNRQKAERHSPSPATQDQIHTYKYIVPTQYLRCRNVCGVAWSGVSPTPRQARIRQKERVNLAGGRLASSYAQARRAGRFRTRLMIGP